MEAAEAVGFGSGSAAVKGNQKYFENIVEAILTRETKRIHAQ